MKLGKVLPEVNLSGKAGELTIAGKGIQYEIWSSALLKGKVRTIYHLAARMGIDNINKNYIEALKACKFPWDKYRTTTILNVDDVFFGGENFARSKFMESKKKHTYASLVLDDNSKVLKKWGLKRKESAVIVIDKEGRVLRFKEGALSKSEISDFLKVIKDNL